MKSQQIASYFECVSDEILLRIFYYVNIESLVKVSLVNKQFLSIARDNQLWKSKFLRHFPYYDKENQQALDPHQKEIDWFEKFKQVYAKEYLELSAHERKLFSYAKDSLSDELSKLISIDFIGEHSQSGDSLLYWISAYCHQSVQDIIYKEFCAYYSHDYINDEGYSLLYWAIRLNQPIDVINDLILKANFPQHEQSYESKQPLYLAAKRGRLDVVKSLVSHGATTNVKNTKNQGTAFSIALQMRNIDIATFLLTRPDIDVDAGHEDTLPLYWAILHANDEFLHKMLPLCTHFTSTATQRAPVFAAIKKGNLKLVTFLLEKKNIDLNFIFESGDTLLTLAVQRQHHAIAKRLLEEGANPNVTTPIGTALELAVQKNDEKMVRQLLDFKADINQPAINRRPLLYIAVQKGYLDIAMLLIEKGAEVNFYRSILHIAAFTGNANIVNTILTYQKVDINAMVMGKTPLHIALLSNQLEIAKLLLSNNADSTICTIITVESLEEHLSRHSPSTKERLTHFIHDKLIDMHLNPTQSLTLFTPSILDISESPKISITPLEIATIMDQKEMIELLNTNVNENSAKKIKR